MQIRLFERPGHRAVGGAAEGDREALHAPGAAPRPRSPDVGAISYPARARESYATDLLAHLDVRRDPRARLPDRRRLRLLGRELRAAAACSARSASRRSPRTRSNPIRRLGAGEAAARRSHTRAGSSRAVDADLGVVFDRSAERIYLIDERGREVPARPDAAALPAPAARERSPRQGRGPRDGDEPGRGARSATGLEIVRDARVAAGARRGPPRTRACLRRRRSAAATSSRTSCPPTTRSHRSASCSSCWHAPRTAAVGARRRAPALDARPPRRCQCPWALKGTVMRVLNERFADARRRPARRHQDLLRRARLGAGAARPGRADHPRLRRGRRRGRLERARRPSSRRSWRACSSGRRSRARS